jgi:hypothetical protein
MPTDKRRYYPIEVSKINDRTFHLTIGGVMWSEVEWSPSRRAWCIQDSQGHCLLHCEHIVGQDIDQRTAIATAKAMVRDGRMPSPEEARAAADIRSAQEPESEVLGEPMEVLEDAVAVKVTTSLQGATRAGPPLKATRAGPSLKGVTKRVPGWRA